MPSSLNGTGVTFNDGTTQSTAATASNYILRTYSSPATWTKPAGLKAVKVTVIGGGGGVGGTGPGPLNPSQLASPGGTSSFGGFLSATGGAGKPLSGAVVRAGGSGAGGDIDVTPYNYYDGYTGFAYVGATLLGGALSASAPAVPGTPGRNYGGGGIGASSAGGSGGGSIEYIASPSIPGPVAVTVGAGGTASGPAAPTGASGAAGIIVVEEFY